MKQIPLLQGKFLLIELPEGTAMECVLHNKNGQNYLAYFENLVHRSVKLPPGNWRIIGMLSEVTEEQARQIARHRKHNTIRDGKLAERLMFYNHTTNIYGQATALESLESAILAEGYYLDENPIDYPNQLDPKFYDEPYDGTGFYQEIYSSAINDWQQAQSRVLDRSRCLLLGREDV